MILKRLEEVALADIQALAANSVPEGRTLEYKAELPGPKDDDKREFLYDVISLANTDGGDLLFGVNAKEGVAIDVPGAPLVDTLDATLLRLESLLSSCVEPRLVGARPRAFELPTGTVVVLWRIPASFAAPHRAGIGSTRRFYHRNSRGKAEMDVHELRAAFTASEGFVPRLASLHQEAVRLVVDGDLPFVLEHGPRAVLSIIPLSVLREPQELDLDQAKAVWPPSQGGISGLQALDGTYVFDVFDGKPTSAFAITRRTGQVDVSWRVGRQVDNGERLIFPIPAEEKINSVATGAAAKLGAFGVEGPFAVGFTLVGVKGFKLVLDHYAAGSPAWRDRLTLPTLLLDALQPEALLPLARNFWLALGEKRPDKPLGKTNT
jgi:hypothetical protein